MTDHDGVVSADELDVATEMFGFKVVPGGLPKGIIEMYDEDDETYFRKLRFNIFWLSDLKRAIAELETKISNGDFKHITG
jgi:hypothetical protein